jgi:hypothetical protein
MKHRLRYIGLIALPLLLASSLGAVAETAGCSGKPHNSREELFADTQKGGTGTETYSVTGVGNQTYLLDDDFNPVAVEDLALSLMHNEKFKAAREVVLVWPYSTWGDAYYAHALEKLVKKPVKGFSGPAWWYPDGAVIASHAGRSTHEEPAESNTAECITPAGRYGEGAECRSLIKTHAARTALFGNAIFMLGCDDIKQLAGMGEKGKAKAVMRLYLYDAFVDIDEGKASRELADAASRGEPLANYMMALTMLHKSPPDEKQYFKFLRRAAMLGNSRARDEIRLIRP